jgi:hypothetical protein
MTGKQCNVATSLRIAKTYRLTLQDESRCGKNGSRLCDGVGPVPMVSLEVDTVIHKLSRLPPSGDPSIKRKSQHIGITTRKAVWDGICDPCNQDTQSCCTVNQHNSTPDGTQYSRDFDLESALLNRSAEQRKSSG